MGENFAASTTCCETCAAGAVRCVAVVVDRDGDALAVGLVVGVGRLSKPISAQYKTRMAPRPSAPAKISFFFSPGLLRSTSAISFIPELPTHYPQRPDAESKSPCLAVTSRANRACPTRRLLPLTPARCSDWHAEARLR